MRNATKRAVASIAVSLLTASALVGFGASAQAATAANTATVAKAGTEAMMEMAAAATEKTLGGKGFCILWYIL